MIYLQPHSGLANRIRVIISGLVFADIVDQELLLIWRKDNSLYCDFTDIFQINNKIVIRNYDWRIEILNCIKNKRFIKPFFNKILSVDFSLFDKDFKEFVWSTGSNNIDFNKLPIKVKNYYFFTCHEFYFDEAYLKYLRPIVSIQKKIDSNIVKFTDKTIGVHIRRTDHAIAINESPLESFIGIMRNDLSKDKDTTFYLATDDKEVEIILMELFPNKILTYEKEFSKTNMKGVQDAMVDLYSLSATCKIYGSYFSSFSDIASRIGDIPLEVIKKRNFLS